ncbi:MAG: hypothetical protein D3907_15535, partial [Candidatus Electrothrix sp. AUS3]|nr:hypothetical protein [Candidatus Electrothrix gigas]
MSLKLQTLILVVLMAAVVLGAVLVGWHRRAPKGEETHVSTIGGNAPATVAGRDVTVNNNGIPLEVIAEQVAKYAEELGATKQLISNFLGTLLEQKVPRDQWDSKLREIAATYKELLTRLETVQSEDQEVQRLKQEGKQAIEAGDYAKAEELLEKAANQYNFSAAATYAELAKLQRVQLRYAKAAEYWQKAAYLLPEGEKKNRAYYLNAAGYDLWHTARYSEALLLYEQSLAILREIGDRAGEGIILSNIGVIHYNQNDYNKALSLYKQSLSISLEVGSGSEEGTTLNNIIWIYHRVRSKYGKLSMLLDNSKTIREITPFLAGLISSPTSDLIWENLLTISREQRLPLSRLK